MAKPYPIVPLSFLDDLSGLNASLQAYHYAVEAILCRFATEGAPYAHETVIAGLDNLFRPVLEGYEGIHSMCSRARKMGMVGIAELDLEQADPKSQ